MGKKVPKKNVEPVLVDIKKPNFNYEQARKFNSLNLRRIAGEYKDSGGGFGWSRVFKWGMGFVAVFLVVMGIFTFMNVKSAKVALEAKGETVSSNLFQSFESIKNFEPEQAEESLRRSKEKLDEINQFIYNDPKNFVLSAGFRFIPFLKDVGSFLQKITQFNIDLIRLSSMVSEIQQNGFTYFQNNGEKFLGLMGEARGLISKIKGDIEVLRNESSKFKGFGYFDRVEKALENNYFVYSSDLYAVEDFIDGMIDLFGSEEEKHILLLFQNSSEIRPAGGFVGSYGELVVKNGQMQDLIVEDIYWPDHPMNFDEKYIAPEPLQRTTKDWGARDANWFFDFSTSAETVSYMLKQSKIYKEKSIEFEGVLGINVDVLGTLVEKLGPIELPEYEMMIDKDNFLAELQEEVETGKDKQAGKNPKKVLSVLAPKLMERLGDLSKGDMESLVEKLSSHVENKDVMFYAEDDRIQNLFRKYGVAGDVYELPSNFLGSYLSVVNANIAGGKTDIYTDQSVSVWLDVNAEGGATGDVMVLRDNNGDKREELWYNTTNKDYIKIFTNPGSELIFAEGTDYRKPIRREYGEEYKKLPVLEEIENTKTYNEKQNVWSTNEFGKKTFATWLLTPAGGESKFDVKYRNPGIDNFELGSGKKFRFVFDKQSGSDTRLDIKISAPLGYLWAESDSSIYPYETENPSKRLIIDLTLKKQFEEEFIKE